MKKTFVFSFVGLLMILIGGVYWWNFVRTEVGGVAPVDNAVVVASPKDATYIIEGKQVTLLNGVSRISAAPGSAGYITTQYFGNEVVRDFNADGRQDTAFLLTQNTGGSGTFYYVVAALNMSQGYVGSHAVLLGDRIAPQTTGMGKGNVVVVNYADRKAGESFAVRPSQGKSIWLLLDPATMQFGEVAQNFEGEANPAMMKLDMKKWNWTKTIYNDGTIVTPKKSGIFSLTLKSDKTFSASTDCNGVGGDYTVKGNTITLTNMISTLMYCVGSQEQDFRKMLNNVQSYMFTSKGELVLGLSYDSGSIIFQ